MSIQTQKPAIQVLKAAGGRMLTKKLSDEVSKILTGNESAKNATNRGHNAAALYSTITKDLYKMTQPDDPNYVQGLCRDWKGGWWYIEPVVYNTGFDLALAKQLMDDTPISEYKPGKSPKGKGGGSRRDLQDAKLRAWVPFLAAAQGMFCAGCGKDDPREASFQVDHIEPLDGGGQTVPGNMQLLCYRCNWTKSNNRSMTDLWEHNKRVGMMWDETEAVNAHKRARIMKGGP